MAFHQRRLAVPPERWGKGNERSGSIRAHHLRLLCNNFSSLGSIISASTFPIPQQQLELQKASWEPVSILPSALPSPASCASANPPIPSKIAVIQILRNGS